MPQAITETTANLGNPAKWFYEIRRAKKVLEMLRQVRRNLSMLREYLDAGQNNSPDPRCTFVLSVNTLRSFDPELAFDFMSRGVEELLNAATNEIDVFNALHELSTLHDIRQEVRQGSARCGMNSQFLRLHRQAHTVSKLHCLVVDTGDDKWMVVLDNRIRRWVFDGAKPIKHDFVHETVQMADVANEVVIETVYCSDEELSVRSSRGHLPAESLNEGIYQYEAEEEAAREALTQLKERLLGAPHYFDWDTHPGALRLWKSNHKGYLNQHLIAAFHTAQLYFFANRFRAARILAQTLIADFDVVIVGKTDVQYPQG